MPRKHSNALPKANKRKPAKKKRVVNIQVTEPEYKTSTTLHLTVTIGELLKGK